ncbi:MAG: DUF4249 domain-containing protein [Crocinitomicaceae bacterium]
MKFNSYIAFFIFSTALFSCTKEIDIDLDEGDRRLVIDAWFTTEEKVHEIRLSQTADYFSNEATPLVSGASVQIDGGGELFSFTETAPGIYHSAPTAHATMGTSYTLNVTYEGELYQATDYCDTVPSLDSLALYPIYNNQNELTRYEFLIWTKELSGYGHYYVWRTLNNSVYIKDTLSEISIESDEYLGDGLEFESFPIESVRASDVNSGDTLKLEQHNISRQTYDAFIAILSETEWRGGIFDSPPANIPSNVSNNGLGVFLVSSTDSREVIVP